MKAQKSRSKKIPKCCKLKNTDCDNPPEIIAFKKAVSTILRFKETPKKILHREEMPYY